MKEKTNEKPSWFRRVWKGWLDLAHFIGNFNSRLILTLFYFLVVGIVSLLVGRWQNTLKKHPPSQSNWLPVSSKEMGLSDAQRQF